MNTRLKAICVCGQICSGKSTITHALSKNYNWDIISFGDYVRHVGLTRNLPTTRSSLQDLGEELFSSSGSFYFLNEVIKFNNPNTITHLFDGVRHIGIINAIQEKYIGTAIFYLRINDKARYNRYLSRSAKGDPITSFENFLDFCSRKTEKEIIAIAKRADLEIDSSLPVGIILHQINEYLLSTGFIGSMQPL